MAALTATQIDRILDEFHDAIINSGRSCTWLKAVARQTITAAGDWVDTNAASFNSALPAAMRTALTVDEKATLLRIVLKYKL